MTRLKSSIILLLIAYATRAQNAYDLEHTVRFGQYLYNTNQFELASQEFERAVYYSPGDSLTNFMLFKTYSILNRRDQALSAYVRYAGNPSLAGMPEQYGSIYVRLLIKNGAFQECLDFIAENCCIPYPNTYYVATQMVQKNWEAAWDRARLLTGEEPNISPLLALVEQSKTVRYKKPFVGALMSAIIPGSGKLYAHNWQDALIGFLMTSASGIVAVRAYNKYGLKNGYTWFAGLMATGYYAGNIYGGQKAVKKYNLKKENEIVDETKRYISDF